MRDEKRQERRTEGSFSSSSTFTVPPVLVPLFNCSLVSKEKQWEIVAPAASRMPSNSRAQTLAGESLRLFRERYDELNQRRTAIVILSRDIDAIPILFSTG
jgi:hypothetical protein